MKIDLREAMDAVANDKYEHEYNGYLAIFDFLVNVAGGHIEVVNAPMCWVPLLLYVGCEVREPFASRWAADNLNWHAAYIGASDKRHVVEMSAAARPEITDFLYIYDTRYCERGPQREKFIVTGNASYFCPELREYEKCLRSYVKDDDVDSCVLVPCSAEKPYPSRLHREVMGLLPSPDWHLIVATGVCGLVPEALWPVMPNYDSGLPNFLRVEETVSWYFTVNHYVRVVVYSDLYAHAISRGLSVPHGFKAKVAEVQYVFGCTPTDRYENLMLESNLRRLHAALE